MDYTNSINIFDSKEYQGNNIKAQYRAQLIGELSVKENRFQELVDIKIEKLPKLINDMEEKQKILDHLKQLDEPTIRKMYYNNRLKNILAEIERREIKLSYHKMNKYREQDLIHRQNWWSK